MDIGCQGNAFIVVADEVCCMSGVTRQLITFF